MEKIITAAGLIVLFFVIFAVVGIIAAIPLYYLWNWLIPDLFGLKSISFWQAWGLFFLSSLLFRSGVASKS